MPTSTSSSRAAAPLRGSDHEGWSRCPWRRAAAEPPRSPHIRAPSFGPHPALPAAPGLARPSPARPPGSSPVPPTAHRAWPTCLPIRPALGVLLRTGPARTGPGRPLCPPPALLRYLPICLRPRPRSLRRCEESRRKYPTTGTARIATASQPGSVMKRTSATSATTAPIASFPAFDICHTPARGLRRDRPAFWCSYGPGPSGPGAVPFSCLPVGRPDRHLLGGGSLVPSRRPPICTTAGPSGEFPGGARSGRRSLRISARPAVLAAGLRPGDAIGRHRPATSRPFGHPCLSPPPTRHARGHPCHGSPVAVGDRREEVAHPTGVSPDVRHAAGSPSPHGRGPGTRHGRRLSGRRGLTATAAYRPVTCTGHPPTGPHTAGRAGIFGLGGRDRDRAGPARGLPCPQPPPPVPASAYAEATVFGAASRQESSRIARSSASSSTAASRTLSHA